MRRHPLIFLQFKRVRINLSTKGKMALSLGPPPIAPESSRFEREEKVDAGSILAERERFMARRVVHSGAAPSDHGIWRSCSSDKRGGVEGGTEELTTPKVSFAEEPDYSKVVLPTAPQRSVPPDDNGCVDRSDTFLWVMVLIIVVLGCIGAFVAFCSRRSKSHRLSLS